MEGKALKRYPMPIIKAAVQLDLLEIGTEYTVITSKRNKEKARKMKLIGCYTDYYLFQDVYTGRKESLLKIDLHKGDVVIEGIIVKEKVQEVVEDLKAKEVEKMKMKQEIMEKLVEEGYQWILKNPGKPYFTNDRLSEALNYPQKQKVLDEIWGALVYEGYENMVETVKGKRGAKGLVYKIQDEAIEPIEQECEIKTTEPEPISIAPESTKEILKLEGLKQGGHLDIGPLIISTYNLLQITGKKVVMDVVFREVQE